MAPEDMKRARRYRVRYLSWKGEEVTFFGTFVRQEISDGIIWFWFRIKDVGMVPYDYQALATGEIRLL